MKDNDRLNPLLRREDLNPCPRPMGNNPADLDSKLATPLPTNPGYRMGLSGCSTDNGSVGKQRIIAQEIFRGWEFHNFRFHQALNEDWHPKPIFLA